MSTSLVSLSSLPKFQLLSKVTMVLLRMLARKRKKFALQTAGHHIQDDANKSVLLHSEFALNTKSLEPLLAIFVRRRQVSALQSYIS